MPDKSDRNYATLGPPLQWRAFDNGRSFRKPRVYSTVTLLARLRGLSTSQPRSKAMW